MTYALAVLAVAYAVGPGLRKTHRLPSLPTFHHGEQS